MLLDMLAAIARKDFTDRRRRQAEGIARAEAEKRFTGRVEDKARNAGIEKMLAAKLSWTQIQDATGCSRAHISRLAKRMREAV